MRGEIPVGELDKRFEIPWRFVSFDSNFTQVEYIRTRILAQIKQLTSDKSGFFSQIMTKITQDIFTKTMLSAPQKARSSLFFTTLNNDTLGTFVPVQLKFLLQKLQVGQGVNIYIYRIFRLGWLRQPQVRQALFSSEIHAAMIAGAF